MPSVATWKPPRIRSGSTSGISARTCSGEISDDGRPKDCARPWRRCSSSQRASVAATSIPPTEWNAPSEPKSSTVWRAKSVMVAEPLCWNTSPGACDVEPPVSHSGPWSSSTTSLRPSFARW